MEFDEKEITKKVNEFQKDFDDALIRLKINEKDREIINLRAEQMITGILMIVTQMTLKN